MYAHTCMQGLMKERINFLPFLHNFFLSFFSGQELEQERHALRLRLESLEAEYENTVKELQDDVSQLRQELHEQQQQLTAGDKDKVNMIRELTQQNERLTDQVQKVRSFNLPWICKIFPFPDY